MSLTLDYLMCYLGRACQKQILRCVPDRFVHKVTHGKEVGELGWTEGEAM